MPERVSADKVEGAKKTLKKVRKQWLKQPDVTAVDVGYKIKDGKLTDELAIRIHVKRKRDKGCLPADEIFTDKDTVDGTQRQNASSSGKNTEQRPS